MASESVVEARVQLRHFSAVLINRQLQLWCPQEDIDEAKHDEAKAFDRLQAAIRAEAVAEWREAVREDTPVDWDCSHCGMTRSVVIRFDEDGLAPAGLTPSLPRLQHL